MNELRELEIKHGGVTRRLSYRHGTSDEGVIQQVFQQVDYDLRRLRRCDEILAYVGSQHRRGLRPLIVDAGANIGASSLYFALAFPTAIVVAIEPEDGNFALLQKNVAGFNVRCIKAALSSSPGSARLVDPGIGHWGYRADPDAGGNLTCVTMREIFAAERNDVTWPFIVKVDIEGGEASVFDKDTAWVDETPIIIVELHDWLLPKAGTARPFLQCVAARDRDFVMVGENIFSIGNRAFG
ncbi:MAG TPA: FkbM family methyltransferase [Candidatus Cybelea sp.]|nr:FkbM family methyltransferase [Candidatus Cybelea sp.]